MLFLIYCGNLHSTDFLYQALLAHNTDIWLLFFKDSLSS